MPTANASSGGQFPKPSYNSGYGSTAYDALGQNTQDYSKGAYPGTGVGQQSKGQNVTNPPTGTGSDITSSMYGKSHVALNKVNVSKVLIHRDAVLTTLYKGEFPLNNLISHSDTVIR